MAVVGISPEEALAICDDLQAHTNEMRVRLGTIGQNIGDLAGAHYVSATMSAFQAKFESESKPQLTEVLNTADAAVEGTRKVIAVQLARQDDAGTEIARV